WQDFESFTNNTPNDTVLFRKPSNSSSTSPFIDGAVTNFTRVTTSFPGGHSSSKVLYASWSFLTGTSNPWLRLTTASTANMPNPPVALDQFVQFDIYSDKALTVGVGLRETGTTAAIGANGGTTGTIDWDGVTNVISGSPKPSKAVAAGVWTTVSLNIPAEAQA